MAEVICPLPQPLKATTHVRSTLLCASIQSLRNRGLYESYLSHLTPAQREEVHALTAGSWLPIDRAVVHYEACDRLDLERSQRIEIGGDVGQRIQQSLVSIIVRLSREGGLTPWSVVSRAEKLRQQTWQGGGIRVCKIGPKDASLEWLEQPCARYAHFRLGLQGILKAVCELYCRRAFVTEDPQPNHEALILRVSWA